MTFEFAYRKAGFFPRRWRKVRVKGFAYDDQLNRAFLFLSEEQGRIEVPQWDSYEVKLGPDWVICEKHAASDTQNKETS